MGDDTQTQAIDGITLTSGSHEDRAKGMCALEAVAFLAGEPHSDAPTCACPVLATFGRRLNDARWPDDTSRTEAMRSAVLALVGSRSTKAVKRARRAYLVDCALRWYAPLAIMAAVGACEARGIDCTALRAAALRLCEAPTRDHAILARDEARRVRYAGDAADAAANAAAYAAAANTPTAFIPAADAAAYAAGAAADAAAAYAVAAYSAYAYSAAARLPILRLAAEHLLTACAIIAPVQP